MRLGLTPVNCAPVVWLTPSVKKPLSSTITVAKPAARKSLIAPVAPSLTTTRLLFVWPAVKFRFDAVGCAASDGHRVRYEPGAVEPVTARLRITAEAPDAGIPEGPPACVLLPPTCRV